MPPGQPVHRCIQCGFLRPCKRFEGDLLCVECAPAEKKTIVADGGQESDRPTDDSERSDEMTRWWGKPLGARRYHVFEGDGSMAQSLCGDWALHYDGRDPEVDPENDTHRDGSDCKDCSRKAGVLDE